MKIHLLIPLALALAIIGCLTANGSANGATVGSLIAISYWAYRNLSHDEN